ncbi:MAG: phosphatidate cytidylyltransferase [Ginsengibacter sp.]
MPFNFAIFKTRALTAVLFAIIMLTGLLWNQWSFIILFIIIHFGCWYEFIKIIRKIHPNNYLYYLPTGLLYISLPVLMMIDLSHPYYNYDVIKKNVFPVIPCGIVLSIWINDTMAYLVGSLIGKTPFSKISPKKTWEGTIGGAISCIALMIVVGWVSRFYKLADWIAIALICGVFGTLGDLLESKLKRMAAIKDSGSFMPGHGGFLDRFDSILAATPLVWLYVYFFMQ